MGEVSGSVELRPVRVALAVAPSMKGLRRAVQLATSAWGGIYHPLLPVDDFNAAQELARLSGSDVIVAVEADSSTGAGHALADLPGFRWKPRGSWGPFEQPSPHLSSRLLGPEANLQAASASRFRPVWQADDPLAGTYSVWFGEYGDSEYENQLREAFDVEATAINLTHGMPIPIINDSVSPLVLTALDIEYAVEYSQTGIVMVDPENPRDLIRLWNLRALGNHVFPWPIGHEPLFRDACNEWLRTQKATDRINRAVRGDRTRIELVTVWTPPEGAESIPNALTEIARAESLDVRHGDEVLHTPTMSTKVHPLSTSYERKFSLTIPEDGREAAIPLPVAPFSSQVGPADSNRIVAAQLTISRESGLGPGRTFSVPNSRKLSILLGHYANYPEVFNRPAAWGRVAGVSVDAEQFYIPVLPTENLITTILDGSQWTTTRSPSGRFATQMIELLGGPRSAAGNQPAVRWVLDTAARSAHGKPLPALINSAKRAKGAWPDSIINRGQADHDYPENVVRFLLARKILRPALPVECPVCATTSHLAPESLTSEYSCDMCGMVNPLGLILSLKHNNPWHYKTASTLTAEQIAETMPIMASINVLHSIFGSAGSGDIPYVLGLKVKEGKIWECELDLVLLAEDRGAPLVIIGEVKSFFDPISETDLTNLAKVQQFLRSEGIECVILAATLREKFEGDELQALRQACEQSPDGSVHRFSDLRPVLPLVLTSRELSAPEFTDNHPTGWGVYDVIEQTEESCRRNLGLSDVSYSGDAASNGRRFSWTDGDPGPIS